MTPMDLVLCERREKVHKAPLPFINIALLFQMWLVYGSSINEKP